MVNSVWGHFLVVIFSSCQWEHDFPLCYIYTFPLSGTHVHLYHKIKKLDFYIILLNSVKAQK